MLLESLYNYWAVIVLMMVGLYTVVAQGNLIKKIIGLNIFQTSVFIFYISVGKVEGGSAPILDGGETLYSNPLPHVLILTAIVVGIATTALALALVLRIKGAYGSVEELDIQGADTVGWAKERSDVPISRGIDGTSPPWMAGCRPAGMPKTHGRSFRPSLCPSYASGEVKIRRSEAEQGSAD